MAQSYGWTRGAELGVRKGATFLHLLQTCPRLSLIGVDLWQPQPQNEGPQRWDYSGVDHEGAERKVREGAARYGDRATLIKASTDDAADLIADGSLDFVFIDADHSTQAVNDDIVNYRPKIRRGGWITGHDINWPEVREAVEAHFSDYKVGPDNCWGVEC